MKLTLPIDSRMLAADFVYGVATASFQIEGAAEKRLPCIWDTFCKQPNTIADQSNGDVACDHYNLWKQDIELIDSLGVDAYRLSISWGRVMNEDGTLNKIGMQFYSDLIDELIKRNIKPFVTLYHWDLPQFLEDRGGWLNRDTAFEFAKYAELVTKHLGDRVYSYATLNEPFCSAFLGYEIGIHAPGKKKLGKKASHNLLLAHGLGMRVIRKNCPNALAGIVLNFTPCYPESDTEQDRLAAQAADEDMNHWYLKPLIHGKYPTLIHDLPLENRPDIYPGDKEILIEPMDFIGINYYTRGVFKHCDVNGHQQVEVKGAQKTDMGWEIYPQGFTDLLVSLNKQYVLPPIYITENGAAMPDVLTNGEVNDINRIQYFQTHLNAVDQAIRDGVNIKGYFAWSLMDNFEWAEGYAKRFGIVYVDYETQKRTLKASSYEYRNLIKTRVQSMAS